MSITELITDQDRKNYEARMEIASLQQELVDEAIRQCGPNATAYGVWVIRDKLKIEPEVRVYCCRRPEHVGWKPEPPPELKLVRMTPDQHPGYDMNGQKFYPFRYDTGMQPLDVMQPLPPEKLAERRASRTVNKLRKQVDDLEHNAAESLFPEMYDDEIQATVSQLQPLESALKETQKPKTHRKKRTPDRST